MKPETEKAYRAWREAAERGYGSTNRACQSPDAMNRADAHIRRLKTAFEVLLAAEKAGSRALRAVGIDGAL